MTREEIQKLIDEETGIYNYGSSDYQVGVCDGVRLADKTMIEKACEYLSETLMDNRDNFGYDVVSSFDTITLNDYIENFKKAMEA